MEFLKSIIKIFLLYEYFIIEILKQHLFFVLNFYKLIAHEF